MPQQRQSPPPNRVSLEQKLELLEARFTEPYDSDTATLNSPSMQVHSFGFDTPVLMGHSNTGSRSNLSTSLQEVNLAAARQMIKVAGGATSDSLLEASNASTHTLITAHLSSKQQQHSKGHPGSIRVQETPPVANVSDEAESKNDKSKADKNRTKRKSANPVKFELPSVRDTFGKTTKEEAPTKDVPTSKAETRKRSRASESNPPALPAVIENASAATEATLATSPNHSRDSKKRHTNKGPTNNRLISNFFKPSNPSKSKAVDVSSEYGAVAPASAGALESTILQPIILHPTGRVSTTPTPSSVTTTMSSTSIDNPQLVSLQRRCEELEHALKETTEQLSAIRNHRSILHANLTVSLERCQSQLTAAKQTHAEELHRMTRVVEEGVRRQAEQEAAAVRATLAMNGARLGQIVVQRVGMRTVEAWQDGQATKTLQATKAKLKKERAELEKRKEAAKQASQRIALKAGKVDSSDVADGDEGEPVGGLVISNRLEATEALRSVEYHLSELARRENDIVREEQALNLEKAAHVRGLKRVNSEDNSRFRSRPKLHDRYILQSLLGKGGFSEVWRAYDLVDLCDVAVKIHQLDPRWSDSKKENYTKHISREYEIHKNVRHPRIVSLYDVFEIDNNSFATVLECCSGGDLDVLLKENKTLAERDARAILLQVLLGMQYLSQPSPDGTRKAIIHYDLKPANSKYSVKCIGSFVCGSSPNVPSSLQYCLMFLETRRLPTLD